MADRRVSGVRFSEDEPHDPLTDLAERIINAIDPDEVKDLRVMVLVTGPETGGSGGANYESLRGMISDIQLHARALIEALAQGETDTHEGEEEQ